MKLGFSSVLLQFLPTISLCFSTSRSSTPTDPMINSQIKAQTLSNSYSEMDPINDLLIGIITEIEIASCTLSLSSEEEGSTLGQSTMRILRDLTAKAKDNTAKDGGVIDVGLVPSNLSSHCQLAQSSVIAAGTVRALLYHYGPAKGKGRKALLSAISLLDGNSSESKILATTVLIAALSAGTNGDVGTGADADADTGTNEKDHRAASRAAVSGILPGGRYLSRKNKMNSKGNNTEGEDTISDESCTSQFGTIAVSSLLQSAASPSSTIHIDLHIVTTFVRAFISDTSPLIGDCSKVVRQILHLESNDDFDEYSPRPQVTKLDAAGAFGLASEIGPWTEMSPRLLVDVAIAMNLWDAAERICISAIQFDSPESDEAVHTLIDSSSERHMYRQSDSLATEFYDNGGRSRYAEARFMHACSTISKVMAKRQYPIIERQVERVDRAFEKINSDHAKYQEDPVRDGPQDIREYALSRLGQCNEHEAAHRFAKLWAMEYYYDAEDAEKYIQARKERYLQWDCIFPGSIIPDVLAHPTDLKAAFIDLLTSRDEGGCIGFDVEWGDTCDGAALLQLSTEKRAILVDVPALISSDEGCDALECTVGKLFAGTNDVEQKVLVVGFSCHEDLSRLSASSRNAQKPWFTKTKAFVDIKPLIGKHKPQLKHLGLSRISEYYLGKPLDKAEQCSLWARRPLTEPQRVYSSLDAWAVAALWSSIHGRQSSITRNAASKYESE